MNSIHVPIQVIISGPRPKESCRVFFVAERLASVMVRKSAAETWVTPYVATNITPLAIPHFRIVGVAIFSNVVIAIKEK